MLATYVFSEQSPSAAGTATSKNPVQNAASWCASGVAGGMLDDASSVDVVAQLVGATGGTLDVVIQVASGQKDATGADVWVDAVHFATLANGAAAVTYRAVLSQLSQPTSSAPVVVGVDNSPALASGVIVQTMAFDRMRLFFTAGTGTTAGAAVKVYVTASLPWKRVAA
jgi:hypothetical protein